MPPPHFLFTCEDPLPSYIRPVYPVEREVSSEVMAENPSTESVQPMEDQGVAESHDDSDDEGPVFLDFTGLAIGKEAEVSSNPLIY